MNVLILGHARHGKDTLAELFQKKAGLSFQSSSWAACEKVVYPAIKDEYGYESIEQCFEDRHNHRALWHDLIKEYNDVPYRLAQEILTESDIYVGMRSNRELQSCKNIGMFDYILTVEAFNRQPPEPRDSLDIDVLTEADYIFNNNGSIKELEYQVDTFVLKYLHTQ